MPDILITVRVPDRIDPTKLDAGTLAEWICTTYNEDLAANAGKYSEYRRGDPIELLGAIWLSNQQGQRRTRPAVPVIAGDLEEPITETPGSLIHGPIGFLRGYQPRERGE